MATRYIDVHSHLNFAAFDGDREEAIRRAHAAGVAVINVGTQADTSRSAVELSEMHPDMYTIVGLHPLHTSKSYHDVEELGEGGKEFTSRGEVFDASVYRDLAGKLKVVAIGECGLDYYRCDESAREIQKKVFIEQINLANELGKPLMLHVRNAYKDALEILHSHAKVGGNAHFFAGTWDEARAFLDLGFTLSFTGVITFARNYDEVIQKAPLDRILSETDCPFVAPVPYRGKRNEPSYVVEIVKKIAEIRNQDLETVRTALLQNAKRVFKIAV